MKSNMVLIISVLTSINFNVMSESTLCFKEEVAIYCEEELEENKSLNGHFYSNGQYYEYSTRRTFFGDWCEQTKTQVEDVMRSDSFCMKFEEPLSNKELTLNSISSKLKRWSYFQ